MNFQISRLDFDDSNRIDSKFEILAESENAIAMVSGPKISILGFGIQKLQKFDVIKNQSKINDFHCFFIEF